MTKHNDGNSKAIVTTVTTSNGETSKTYETFVGTDAEVKAQVAALKKGGSHLITETNTNVEVLKEEI